MDGLTKIYKLMFMASGNECKIKKESPMILKETNKTYKIEHGGVISKSKINQLRVSSYSDTHSMFVRSAWATEDQVEAIAKQFEDQANAHFKRIIEGAEKATIHIRKAYHGK